MSVHCTCLSLLLAQLCVLGGARSADMSGGNEFRTDYTFSHEAAGWLKLHRVPLDWNTARVQCYHEGAVLASPLNAEMWIALTELLSQSELDSTHVFSGVSSTLIDGVFSSIEGVALDYLYIQWDKDQPNNLDGNPHCVTYYKHGGMLTVHDESCTKLLPYICYRPASVSDKVTECGTVDKEYKLDARTGHCYKFHRHGTTWEHAGRVCQAEGGHLAVIDSQPEADLLADLFVTPGLLYTEFQDVAFVGFKKWGNDNSWWTIHGKWLEESGYSRWSQGQPNNLGRPQECGAINVDGLLEDMWCDSEPIAFICEKSPDSLTQDSQPSPSFISGSSQVQNSVEGVFTFLDKN